MALENERDEIAQGLFDYGYDPKAKDEYGRSLLHMAQQFDTTSETLLQLKGEVN